MKKITKMTMSKTNSERLVAILESSAKMFLRYGYKKTSMDELARAADLSRQGLYLYFKTKEALFKAAIEHLIEATRIAYQAELNRTELSLSDRILNAFSAFHGCSIGQVGEQYVDEILETAMNLLKDMPATHEQQFITDVTEQLEEAFRERPIGHTAIAPRDLVETLCATSYGLKHRVGTLAEYQERMTIALRIALNRDEK